MEKEVPKGGPTQAGFDRVAKKMTDRCADEIFDGTTRTFTGVHVYEMFRQILTKTGPTGNGSIYDDAQVKQIELMKRLETAVLGKSPDEFAQGSKKVAKAGGAASSQPSNTGLQIKTTTSSKDARKPVGGRSDVHPEKFSSRAARGAAMEKIDGAIATVSKLRETQLLDAKREAVKKQIDAVKDIKNAYNEFKATRDPLDKLTAVELAKTIDAAYLAHCPIAVQDWVSESKAATVGAAVDAADDADVNEDDDADEEDDGEEGEGDGEEGGAEEEDEKDEE